VIFLLYYVDVHHFTVNVAKLLILFFFWGGMALKSMNDNI